MMVLSQNLAQDAQVVLQIVFLNHAIGPDGLHQFVFVQQAPGVVDENAKRVKHFAAQGNHATITNQLALAHVKPKRTEGVTLGRHVAPPNMRGSQAQSKWERKGGCTRSCKRAAALFSNGMSAEQDALRGRTRKKRWRGRFVER